jgi:SsrA-binding protein
MLFLGEDFSRPADFKRKMMQNRLIRTWQVHLVCLLLLFFAAKCAAFHRRFFSNRKSHVVLFKAPPKSMEDRHIAENRNAQFEYEFTEKYEAGIQLVGTEVKSCRKSTVQLSDGVCEIRDGEAFLLNVHISEYSKCGRREQHLPKRVRKLLLTKKEILKLEQRVLQRNCEIIPIKMFFSEKQLVKVELGVGMKKSVIDKRDTEMKRDGEREVRRIMKGSYD